MIAWYSRDRSWFNNSISSGRDTFLEPPAVVSSFKAFSSRVECGNCFRTFRSLKCVGSDTLTVPRTSPPKLCKTEQSGGLAQLWFHSFLAMLAEAAPPLRSLQRWAAVLPGPRGFWL